MPDTKTTKGTYSDSLVIRGIELRAFISDDGERILEEQPITKLMQEIGGLRNLTKEESRELINFYDEARVATRVDA